MAKRIAILTGGGDCPGLNAAIRAVVKYADEAYGWDVIGIRDSFGGLYTSDYVELSRSSVTNLLDRGGTILGSSNRANPFAYPVTLPNGSEEVHDVSHRCASNLSKLGVEGLIVVGGDGTMSIASRMMDMGARIVGIPKTIDNDLEATDYTIGFQTAVDVVCAAVDRLHTTAESHDRIIICEVMGRYAGWIAITAGLASGADIILVPEIEYDIESVIGAVDRRHAYGTSYSIVVVAEGAVPVGGKHAVKQQGDLTQQERLGGAGQRLANEIAERSSYDVRVTVLGHVQRGGTPCAFDRVLATRFGVKAIELIASGSFGQVTALRGGQVVSAPMDLAVAKLKRLDPESDLVRTARAIGIEMGA